MSANSSSSSAVPLQPAGALFSNCFGSTVSNIIFLAFTVSSSLLLIPLSVTILHLGRQRWRRSASPSHSDIITYHMVVMEMTCVIGSFSYCVGVYFDLAKTMMVASHVFFITACGQMSFHVLTCAERYLAVVRPVTYRDLRRGRGVTIRNASIWCVWLLSCAEMSLTAANTVDIIVLVYFVQLALTLVCVSFCSLSVLRALKRPGPGDGARARVDQSKRRAFHTIAVIMGTLLLKFGGSLVCTALFSSALLSSTQRCVVFEASFWFGLPSSLVLPLLFLHRAAQLPCCRSNTESGPGSA